ncbi:MAG: hypothetical protein DRJ03_31150 [Chloroflexi bacterium]|nr:MAG: hypothetical protein DRI81_15450 [Chloroflexota bacterium]RLC74902.1 MAG: hypothetical protein DRJ03_31150 [Chloroflexota bacterium]
MDRLLNTCAWCNKEIPEDVEVFGFGAKSQPGVDFSEQEGTIIQLPLALAGRTVSAIVVTSDSEAKRDGYDFAFLACSQKCAQSLKEALQREIDLIESVR